MENIGTLLNYIMEGLKTEFTIYGHTFSWWQVFVFIIVASLFAKIIGGILGE